MGPRVQSTRVQSLNVQASSLPESKHPKSKRPGVQLFQYAVEHSQAKQTKEPKKKHKLKGT